MKTKYLANRLQVDRNELTLHLNELQKNGNVIYVNSSTRQEYKICGWVFCHNQDHHVKDFINFYKAKPQCHVNRNVNLFFNS